MQRAAQRGKGLEPVRPAHARRPFVAEVRFPPARLDCRALSATFLQLHRELHDDLCAWAELQIQQAVAQ